MPIRQLKDIINQRPKNVRLLGLDIGSKTIGLALSDPLCTIATPLKTIHRTKFTRDINELKQVINEYEIGGYVLGYPLNMDGTEGRKCDSVTSFAHEMLNYPQIFGTDPWISLWDERLSTSVMQDFLIDKADLSRKKRGAVIDKLAAQHILQGALDFIQYPP